MKRILKPVTYVLAALYFLVDAAFMAIVKPISDWLARHVVLRRLRAWIKSLRPFPSLALFSVPVLEATEAWQTIRIRTNQVLETERGKYLRTTLNFRSNEAARRDFNAPVLRAYPGAKIRRPDLAHRSSQNAEEFSRIAGHELRERFLTEVHRDVR